MIRAVILIAVVITCVCSMRAVNLLQDISGTMRMIHIELHHLNWDKE